MNLVTGEIFGIDFGISFGNGLNLPLPELTPFRLTRQFETLMMPVGFNGIFKHSMIFSLTALKNKKNILLDCCEIFIRDPLLDWINFAKNKNVNTNSSNNKDKKYNFEVSLSIEEQVLLYFLIIKVDYQNFIFFYLKSNYFLSNK